ncbi:MAG: DUF454 domain-containing protein [Sphingomonadales bacterium]|nr:DUF454 domain-containing protein [Sphingomonadales bacterium]
MKRHLYLIAGIVSVALGTVGIFLPLLPTVPFMILAAFCFAKSSPALEKRLTDDPRFGPHIRAWREKGAVSRKGKIAATLAFTVSIALGAWMMIMPYALIPPAIAAICLTWLWTRPER